MSTSSSGFDSLLKWLNTFELSQPCEKLDDLRSGHILQSCLATVCPEAAGPDKDPWVVITKKLEEYCGCSLDNAVSLKQVKHGDPEHLARMVVLLLCYFVEDESVNHSVIERIMQLPLEVQQDLMSLIESGLGKVNGNTLSTGNFNSGVGVNSRAASHGTSPHFESRGSVTPSRPSRHRTRSVMFRGLESPAAQKWLRSPAFSARKRKTMSKTPLIVSITNSSKKTKAKTDNSSEDLKVLQHQLSVLEKKIESERELTVDLNTELESMAQTCTNLRETNSELELRIQSKGDKVKDLEDELTFKENRLKKAETAVAKYKQEVESLSVLKETCRELEKKMANHESMKAQLQEQLKKLHSLELGQVEKDMELKRLTIAHEMKLLELQLALESKERSHQALMDASKERDDLSQRIKLLEREKLKLEAIERQKSVITEQLEELRSGLAASETQVKSLSTSNKNLQDKVDQVNEAHKVHKLQLTERLQAMEAINDELKAKLTTAVKECDTHKVEAQAVHAANTNLQAKLDTAHASWKQQTETLERANNDLQAIHNTACEEHELFKRKLNDEMCSLRDTNTNLQSRLDTACQEHHSYTQKVNEQVESLQKANGDLRASLDAAHEEHKSQLQKMKSEMEAVMTSNGNLQAKIKAGHEEHRAYKSETALQLKILQALNTELRGKLDVALQEQNSRKQQVQALERAITEHQAKLYTVGEEQDSYKQQVQTLRRNSTNLQSKLSAVHEEKDLCGQQMQALERTNTGLQDQLDKEKESWQQQVQALKKNITELQGKLVTEQESKNLQQQCFERTISDLHTKLDEASKEQESWKQRVQALECNEADLQAKLNTARQEKESFKQQLQTMEKSQADLQGQLDSVGKELESREQRVQALKRDNTELQAKLESATGEYETLKQQTSDQVQALERINIDVQVKSNEVHHEYESYKTKMTDKVETLEKASVDLQARLDTACKDHELYKAQVDGQMHDLRAAKTAELAAASNEFQSYKLTSARQINTLEKANSDLQATLDATRTKCKEESSTFEKAQSALLARLETARSQYQEEVHALERAKADLQAGMEAMREEHHSFSIEVNGRMQFLQRENAQLGNELRYVERELKEQRASQELQRSFAAPKIANITNTVLNSTSTWSADMSSSGLARTGSDENRVGELQRRNKMLYPHLKSSYPVEMQVKPESPSVSNDTIKNGSKQSNKSARSSTKTSRESTAFTVSFDSSPENASRKRSREFDRSFSSPPASHRRISAPPTPDSMTVKTRALRPTTAELRRGTLASSKSMGLRNYLDAPIPVPVSSSTSFDVTFSPPKSKRAMPKRQNSKTKESVPEEQRQAMPKKFQNSTNKFSKTKESVPEEQRQTMVKTSQTRNKK